MTKDEARAALQRHEAQRREAWSTPPVLLNSPEQYFFEGNDGRSHEVKRRPGRQVALYNRNARTFQSHKAAQFIHEEMQIFRSDNDVTRVHKLVRDRFWEIAKARYPQAEESIVWDHVRMNRKRL
jgi:hypothetical protein